MDTQSFTMIDGHPWYEFVKARKNVIWWMHNSRKMTEEQISSELHTSLEEIKTITKWTNENDR